jgi:protein associated with RNAse G/E
MKTLTELRNEFIKNMQTYDYENEMIYMLSHNVDTLLFIDYQITQKTEYATIESLFDDVGFHEFLQSQYETPITFDEMF